MQNIGKIFKKFRESRRLSLRDVAKKGLSTSQLSRFENGETDLTVSKFMTALEAINLPIHEFMYTSYGFRRDPLNELLEEIRKCVVQKDITALKHLLFKQIEKKPHSLFQKLNIILVKIRLQDLSGEKFYTDKDIQILTDYLFKVEYWGEYELLLFSNTLDVLNHNTFMALSREMIHRSDFYKDLPNNRRLIASMMLNAYITCISQEYFLDATYFEKELKNCFFTEVEVFERLIFKYASYLYQYKKNNDKMSIVEMRKCIATLKLVSSNRLAKLYEDHLDKILDCKR